MAVIDLFSRRKKRDSNKPIEVFQYENVPSSLRVQIVHIWKDAFGEQDAFMSHTPYIYREMHHALAREFGTFQLGESHQDDFSSLANYFLTTRDPDKALDIVEFTFQTLEKYSTDWQFRQYSNPKVSAQSAIQELNQRFLQHSVGYEFANGQLVRKDKEILHKEVVLPALALLYEREFAGANEEYLSAHEHYRKGKYKECLNDCLKSFESTMKVICTKKKNQTQQPKR